ncbi:UPF0481 protein At3g47200-like [Trifolium pratense]|uniref:UPF0481 protein At3g47200-like n=1 Tax=Trifolium pratense TaxID=57577 RepID=UPI001E6916F8|nr:UPF0481 protein At3g47200-like [Trifolium pratense]
MEAQPNELTKMLEAVVLPEESGTHEQCIYKVPQKIRQVNPQAYTPRLISIGPFHNPLGSNSVENHLQEMEGLKLKYLKGFHKRTNISIDNLFSRVKEWENEIRKCYAGPVSLNSKDFLKIIIVDACFIIEHFLRRFSYTNWNKIDPILLKPYLLDDIFRDLILLENQLPFFVLENIYNLAKLNLPSFITITIQYFTEFNQQNLNSGDFTGPKLPKHFTEPEPPKHFTDLIRTFLLPSSFNFTPEGTGKIDHAMEQVYSVSQLSEAGLKFELSDSKCLLDLKFDKGVLKMPCFLVHDSTERYMRNILAFEECHISDKHSAYISQYFTLLDILINTESDVSILVDKKIIINWTSDANAVATMVNTLCKNASMPKYNAEYLSLFKTLNGFYENPRNKYKAIFVHEYFNTPWKIASTTTAVLLVLFTLIQAVCSIWSLVKSYKDKK